MTTPIHELEAYFAGNADAEQLRAVEAWIHADPANARSFMDQLRFRELLGEHLREQANQSALALAELARLHEEGLKQPLDLELHNKKRDQHAHTHQAQPLRLKTKLIITGSLAAAIALAGLTVLIVNLFTSPEQPLANQLDEAIIVATLTDTQDAQWGTTPTERALAPGSPLHAGDRLTLTAGFAEITTQRGAIAVIEAPATIELIDSLNALRLHEGKLAGICETESSKGFVVHTKHAQITDIGTMFGVWVSDDDTTQIQVHQGEVHAAALDSSGTVQVPLPIFKGQAVSVQPGAVIKHATFEPELYERAVAAADQFKSVVLTRVERLGVVPQSLLSGRQEADALQVFVEHQGFDLQNDIKVDFASRGNLNVPAGKKVDVYLLHFDPLDSGKFLQRGEFVVSFDRPIVGVIGYAGAINNSNPQFLLPGKAYIGELPSAGLESDNSDHVSISPDGKTLKLTLFAARTFVDQLRVLVAAEE